MGKKDSATREYIQDENIFADIFNYFIFGGKKVIEAQSLEEMDTSALLTVFGKDGDEEAVQRYRDALKKAVLMIGEEAAYVVLGIEAQTYIDYGMPIRTFLYDGLQYDRQAKIIKAAHIADGDKPEKDEFVSGLYKDDRILPVITVVVYFGSKPWDGATRLSDLYKCKSKEIMNLAPDYKMNLIEPARMTDEDFKKFSTDMGEVLKFMKASGDKDEMKKLMKTDEAYKNLSRNAARVIRECANVKLKFGSRKKVINLCKAWEDAAKDAKEEGIREGAILSAIDMCRDLGVLESEIMTRIVTKYNLTVEEANEYMAGKSALHA